MRQDSDRSIETTARFLLREHVEDVGAKGLDFLAGYRSPFFGLLHHRSSRIATRLHHEAPRMVPRIHPNDN